MSATEPAAEPQPSDGSNSEPNMSDEEFEAFMKKAQAFYDAQANENGIASATLRSRQALSTTPRNDEEDDDDDFPSIEVHSGDN